MFTLSQTTNFLKDFADDNFKFDENGRRFSTRVENTVGKGEKIARHEQFLLFPQCFQKTCITNTCKPGPVPNKPWSFTRMQYTSFENIVGKAINFSLSHSV